MRGDFSQSQKGGAPLGKNGEITEWLAVKERDDGKVRCMTVREASDYHIKDVWKYMDLGDPVHTLSHLLVALSYGNHVTPTNYQGGFQTEVVVLAVENLADAILKGGEVPKISACRNYFYDSTRRHYYDLYPISMFYRTLAYAIADVRQAKGRETGLTAQEIFDETGNERLPLRFLAEDEGVVIKQKDNRNFEVSANSRAFSLASENYSFLKSLPPEGKNFQDFSPVPRDVAMQVLERVYPAIVYIKTRENEVREQGQRFVFYSDFFKHIEMTELRNAMDVALEADPSAYFRSVVAPSPGSPVFKQDLV